MVRSQNTGKKGRSVPFLEHRHNRTRLGSVIDSVFNGLLDPDPYFEYRIWIQVHNKYGWETMFEMQDMNVKGSPR